jgi:hypothetical protein
MVELFTFTICILGIGCFAWFVACQLANYFDGED